MHPLEFMIALVFSLGISSSHPFNDVPKIMATTVKLMIDNTFFIPQIYETCRTFAQNGGITLWFDVFLKITANDLCMSSSVLKGAISYTLCWR